MINKLSPLELYGIYSLEILYSMLTAGCGIYRDIMRFLELLVNIYIVRIFRTEISCARNRT